MSVRTIDNDRRAALLRQVLRNDRGAVGELADLYEQAGYTHLAAATRQAGTNALAWDYLQQMARGYLRDQRGK
jgi:hypothetical protein